MDIQKLSAGMILIGIGVLFFFNNKNIAKGASALYQKLYTEKNLKIIFKIMGALLALGGVIVLVTK